MINVYFTLRKILKKAASGFEKILDLSITVQ